MNISESINNKLFGGVIENPRISELFDLLIALLVLYITYKVISYLLSRTIQKLKKHDDKALNTTVQIINNILKVMFVVIGIFSILDFFHINTASLIATAGIGGVAIGFGAQSLVKDVINGIFILFEGQLFIGDEVVINGINGNVVDTNMRTTTIKDFNTGALHIIPNGEIKAVENRSRVDNNASFTFDVPMEYDPKVVLEILNEAMANFKSEDIVDGPTILGISNFKERSYSIFLSMTTVNGKFYKARRDVRYVILESLYEKGIILSPKIKFEGEEDAIL